MFLKFYRKVYYLILVVIYFKVVCVCFREARRIRESSRRFRANTDKKDKKF